MQRFLKSAAIVSAVSVIGCASYFFSAKAASAQPKGINDDYLDFNITTGESFYPRTQVKSELNPLLAKFNLKDAATPAWKKFSSREGEFSVLIPNEEIININSNHRLYRVRTHSVNHQQSQYMVAYVDFKVDISTLSPNQLFDSFLQGFLSKDTKLLRQSNINLNKYSGREFKFTKGKIIGKGRLFIVNQRVYILLVSNSPSGDTKKFFDSFQLNP